VYCDATYVYDNHGQFVGAYSKQFDGTPDIAKAEAARMKEVMC
jgi:hypothetical protein